MSEELAYPKPVKRERRRPAGFALALRKDSIRQDGKQKPERYQRQERSPRITNSRLKELMAESPWRKWSAMAMEYDPMTAEDRDLRLTRLCHELSWFDDPELEFMAYLYDIYYIFIPDDTKAYLPHRIAGNYFNIRREVHRKALNEWEECRLEPSKATMELNFAKIKKILGLPPELTIAEFDLMLFKGEVDYKKATKELAGEREYYYSAKVLRMRGM